MILDPFDRTISYLRVSVTDRCDFRCVYCMAEDMTFLPKADLLTLDELDRLASVFIALGVSKLRITGGEPLVRRGVIELFGALSRHLRSGALAELTLTTNGSQLARFADALAACGVRRVNVSIDSLIVERFAAITRRGRLAQVLEGVAAAKAAGLRVKINTVALKGVNDDEFDDLIAWCGNHGFDLCLIETMPLGDIDGDRTAHYLPLNEVRTRLERRWTLVDCLPVSPGDRLGGPARYVRIAETGQRLGFITPLTHTFCAACNRVRLTCTGRLYLCLGQEHFVDLRELLRAGAQDGPLIAAIARAIANKPRGHDFVIDGAQPILRRTMSVTGG